MASNVTIRTVGDANRAVRRMVDSELLPRLGVPPWRSRFRHGSTECYEVASKIHVNLIRIGTRRRVDRFSVGVGIAVRYPLQHWLMTLGGTSAVGGTTIGYHVGLRHHAPGKDEWDMGNEEWERGIISDVEAYGAAFFATMSTPQMIIDLVQRTVPKDRLFTLGGAEEEVRLIATMLYAYIDPQQAIETLADWLKKKESHRARRTLEFLESRPTLPDLKPTD